MAHAFTPDTSVNKRRKTGPEANVKVSRPNAIAGSSRRPGESISEPTSRRDSVILSERPSSQPVSSRKRKGKRKLILDYVLIPTYAESRRRYQESSLPTPSPSLRPPPARHPPPLPSEEEEDYGSWEAGVSMSMAELKDVRHTFGCDTEYCKLPIALKTASVSLIYLVASSDEEAASSTSLDIGDSRPSEQS